MARDSPLQAYELPEQPNDVNPIPEDLLESMGRLRFHEMAQSECMEGVRGVMGVSEMPDSTAVDVAGSNYELLTVADKIVGDCLPHSRIALAGLSGSG